MNWDTTNIRFSSTNYSSTPLTIKKIKENKDPENRDGYLIEVGENITYQKGLSSETVLSQEIRTFKHTYKDGNHVVNSISKDQDGTAYDAFYYFVHYLNKKIEPGIPFRKFLFSNNLNDRVFFLSDNADFSNRDSKGVNDIVKQEKEKWDETGYTEKKDLKAENKGLVDAKWEALHRDTNGREWSPQLSKEEKESIKNASTIEKVQEIQKEITNSEGRKTGQNLQNALTTNPQTGTNWDPILTEEEKEVIKDPNLDTKGAIQAAAKLLSHLRDIRNDEKNGGPNGKLTDWDTTEKVNGAISAFQKNHYDNLLPYQQASVDSDQGKAWKVTNSKLNNVAENVYNRYWSLICNISVHQELQEKIKEYEKKFERMQNQVKALREEMGAVSKPETEARIQQVDRPPFGGGNN